MQPKPKAMEEGREGEREGGREGGREGREGGEGGREGGREGREGGREGGSTTCRQKGKQLHYQGYQSYNYPHTKEEFVN